MSAKRPAGIGRALSKRAKLEADDQEQQQESSGTAAAEQHKEEEQAEQDDSMEIPSTGDDLEDVEGLLKLAAKVEDAGDLEKATLYYRGAVHELDKFARQQEEEQESDSLRKKDDSAVADRDHDNSGRRVRFFRLFGDALSSLGAVDQEARDSFDAYLEAAMARYESGYELAEKRLAEKKCDEQDAKLYLAYGLCLLKRAIQDRTVNERLMTVFNESRTSFEKALGIFKAESDIGDALEELISITVATAESMHEAKRKEEMSKTVKEYLEQYKKLDACKSIDGQKTLGHGLLSAITLRINQHGAVPAESKDDLKEVIRNLSELAHKIEEEKGAPDAFVLAWLGEAKFHLSIAISRESGETQESNELYDEAKALVQRAAELDEDAVPHDLLENFEDDEDDGDDDDGDDDDGEDEDGDEDADEEDADEEDEDGDEDE